MSSIGEPLRPQVEAEPPLVFDTDNLKPVRLEIGGLHDVHLKLFEVVADLIAHLEDENDDD